MIMAALHNALKTLSPTAFSSVPTKTPELKEYLQDAFHRAQVLIDSVPLPPPPTTGRSRANTTTSIASNASEISPSPARSDPPRAEHAILQKEWGKPVKLTPKENPLGMTVYKLAGKDGKGAWFARRSVHEGLGFEKWKKGLQREFPETMEVQGGPGEGNIRGIGAEKRVERHVVEGVGMAEVYHLSAQFPGPTTPRDFVTLLLTSDSALIDEASSRPASSASEGHPPRLTSRPPHFMVISKPCDHPDCPPRDGFVRGQYESIEFVQEIPLKPEESPTSEGEELANPVEWIMITRSDPGGSVPRFMVERGTPSSIVADASKFLDWACRADHPTIEEDHQDDNLKVGNSVGERNVSESSAESTTNQPTRHDDPDDQSAPQTSLLSSVTNAAYAGLEAYAPQVVVDHLPALSNTTCDEQVDRPSVSRPSSSESFASAEDGLDSSSETQADDKGHINGIVTGAYAQLNGTERSRHGTTSSKSTTTSETGNPLAKDASPSMTTVHDRELAKLNEKKKKLDEQLAKTREKELKNKEELTSKEQERLQKAAEKHARDVAKQEEKYKKEVAKLEAKRAKDAAKLEERKRKAEDKDEKTRLVRERDALKAELDVVRKERDILGEQVRDLQMENTALVARFGRVGGDGTEAVARVRAEVRRGGEESQWEFEARGRGRGAGGGRENARVRGGGAGCGAGAVRAGAGG
ncbi:MAG: hypothetical protein FRX48_08153 [Lasallia pustulata]|uniref:DUF3074 domain-containing protein n=1 Tax=Lasallia pustulata TaxID=136370 RepID=A0A5M8PGH8_9LECA|nr:MAG: hypothetical protein FRX48_08153 [Lasallia pustulata]